MDFQDVCPRSVVVFMIQAVTVLVVVVGAVINLSVNNADRELWLVLLSTALGYIMPAPGLRKKTPTLP